MATALAAKKAAPKRANGNARDPERTRAVILAAATAEITAKGLGGARVDEIAERAGVNKRMIYHYFGDKDGLYLAVLEAAYQLIRSEEIKLDLKQRDPVEGMRELVQFTWNYYRLHPEFLSLLATENLHRSAYLKRSKKIRELHSPLVGLIEDLCSAARRPRYSARTSTRSNSIFRSPHSAFSTCPTATRCPRSSAAT